MAACKEIINAEKIHSMRKFDQMNHNQNIKTLVTDSNYSSMSGCNKNFSTTRYKVRQNPIRDMLSCKIDLIQQSKGYVFEFIYRSALLLWNTELRPPKKVTDLNDESDSGPEFDADVMIY